LYGGRDGQQLLGLVFESDDLALPALRSPEDRHQLELRKEPVIYLILIVRAHGQSGCQADMAIAEEFEDHRADFVWKQF
jgi:hypothetical protein